MDQTLINWLFGIAGFLVGWLVKILWQMVRDLQRADIDLTTKVQAIEVLVAGQYVKRDELDRSLAPVFEYLRRIEDKLDHKADK